MAQVPIWVFFLAGFLFFLIGLIVGFFLTRMIIIRELKKNPPINADMIRAMYNQMGRKPSETQVQSVVSAMMKHK